MQQVIEEIIRWLGWSALKLMTFGRYKGGGPSDVVAEGGVGLAIIAAGMLLMVM